MLKDRYGLEISTSSVEARDAYVEAIDRMLAAYGHVEEALDATLAADPDFALAHAASARQHQLMGRPKEGRAAAETAAGLVDGATPRERQHVEIISQLVGGQIPASLELTRQHVQDHPRDAFVVDPACGVFGSIGFSGRVDREQEQLDFLEPLATHYGDDWWFQTVYAFAQLETGHWEKGLEHVQRALDQRPDSPHGAHTLAHALYEGGQDEESLSFLDGWIPDFDRSSLMHCHNWWHYAVLLMGAGRTDDAWKALEENCMPGATNSSVINVLTDSASFLWRSELGGIPRRPELWAQVREYYEEQFRRPIVFVDAHAGLSYAALGDNEKLEACITQLQELGEAGKLPAGTTAATLTRAYAAFVAEDWSRVIDTLEPVMPQVVRIGGSRAQRDLVTNTLLAAYVNDGRPDAAAAFLSEVHDRQPSRPIAGLAAG